MFRSTIISIFIFATLQVCKAQDIHLRDNCHIDTLHVSLSFAEGTNMALQGHMRSVFDSVVKDFNYEKTKFKIIVDSTSSYSSLHVNMSVVEYVSKKRNLSFTAMNLAFVAGTIFINSMTGYIIPFLMFPSASINIEISLSPDLSATTASMNSFASGNGFWLKQESQDTRLVYGFGASMEEIFRRTHVHYNRMRKKQARKSRKENVALISSR